MGSGVRWARVTSPGSPGDYAGICIMTVPSRWTRFRFGDMAVSVTERVDDPSTAGVDRYVGLDHLDSGSLRIARWGAPSDVEATKLRFAPGDIIFGRRRA